LRNSPVHFLQNKIISPAPKNRETQSPLEIVTPSQKLVNQSLFQAVYEIPCERYVEGYILKNVIVVAVKQFANVLAGFP
jgi:hypothetical protein